MGSILAYPNQGRWTEAEKMEVQVYGDESEGARRRASLHVDQYEQSCLHNEKSKPKCGGHRTYGSLIHLRNRTLGTEHPHALSSAATLAEWQNIK